MNLNRLLSPRSVAVFGGKEGSRVIEQCDKLGFTGELWPIHPTRTEIAGRPCFRSVDDLPGVPDAAFFAIPKEAVIENIQALSKMGAGGAVVYSAGFSEAGHDEDQAQLIMAAANMPLIGPNCYGFLNTLDRVALWPDQHGAQPAERGAAIVTQSGNMAISMTLQQRGLALTHAITLGNQAIIGIEECMEHLLTDDRVRAIGIHCEGIADPARFARAAVTAHEQRVPLVILKTGASEHGAALGLTHTATLTGPHHAWQAFFSHYGIVQTTNMVEFLEVLKFLTEIGPLAGRRMITMSSSGGEAALIADRSEHFDVTFPPFEDAHAVEVAKHVHPLVALTNPLDYHTFDWANRVALEGCFTEIMRGSFDVVGLIMDIPNPPLDDAEWRITLDALIAAHKTTGTPTFLAVTLPENLSDEHRQKLLAHGVVPVQGLEEMFRSIEAAARLGRHYERGTPTAIDMAPRTGTTAMSERDTALPRPRSFEVDSVEEALASAEKLGYPVVLKTLGIAHKTEVGGVVVGINDEDRLRAEFKAMSHLSDEFSVEQQVTNVVAQLVVSARWADPVGGILTVGAGGQLVELFDDVANVLIPASRQAIESALRQLRIAPLLDGYRGQTGAEIVQLVSVIEQIQQVWLEDEELASLEINPLMVTPTEAIAVDILMEELT